MHSNFWFGVIVVCVVVGSYSVLKLTIALVDYLTLRNSDYLYSVLQYVLKTVFEFIYRNHILAYKMSGALLNQEETDEFRKLYLENVYSTLGKGHTKKLEKLFGDRESLDLFILLYFEERLDSSISSPTLKEESEE